MTITVKRRRFPKDADHKLWVNIRDMYLEDIGIIKVRPGFPHRSFERIVEDLAEAEVEVIIINNLIRADMKNDFRFDGLRKTALAIKKDCKDRLMLKMKDIISMYPPPLPEKEEDALVYNRPDWKPPDADSNA